MQLYIYIYIYIYKYTSIRSERIEQCIYCLEKISLHELFSVYVMTYTNIVRGGNVYEEFKTSVLKPVSLSYHNMPNVRKIEHVLTWQLPLCERQKQLFKRYIQNSIFLNVN